jgi:hypothetical protein
MTRAVEARDLEALRGELRRLRGSTGEGTEADRTALGPAQREDLLEIGAGFELMLSGDIGMGSERVESALEAGAFEARVGMTLGWLDLLVDAGAEYGARATALLERSWGVHPIYELERVRLLAKSLERLGRDADAAVEYARYAAALEGADSDLPVAARAERAREAAARLAGAGVGDRSP